MDISKIRNLEINWGPAPKPPDQEKDLYNPLSRLRMVDILLLNLA
jgi:hypothetical protein